MSVHILFITLAPHPPLSLPGARKQHQEHSPYSFGLGALSYQNPVRSVDQNLKLFKLFTRRLESRLLILFRRALLCSICGCETTKMQTLWKYMYGVPAYQLPRSWIVGSKTSNLCYYSEPKIPSLRCQISLAIQLWCSNSRQKVLSTSTVHT